MRQAAVARRRRCCALNSSSWHLVGALRQRRARCCAPLRRRQLSGLFARPEITLDELERRFVQVVEGNDSGHLTWSWSLCEPQPVRAVALASCAHSKGDLPLASGQAATSAVGASAADLDDESAGRMIQLWPPQNVQDPSNCNALSSTGIGQCKAAVDEESNGWLPLLRDLHPPRGVVVISSDEACRESAEMILGKFQPNGDHYQYVELASNTPMTGRQLQGHGRLEPWELPGADAGVPLPTLAEYHSTGGERGQQALRRHAIRLFHDVIVEMERDALLYPFLNEPSGDSGNSLLLFGGALHNAEFALLLAEALGLGWKAKRTILETPLAHASLLVVSGDGVTAVAPPEL